MYQLLYSDWTKKDINKFSQSEKIRGKYFNDNLDNELNQKKLSNIRKAGIGIENEMREGYDPFKRPWTVSYADQAQSILPELEECENEVSACKVVNLLKPVNYQKSNQVASKFSLSPSSCHFANNNGHENLISSSIPSNMEEILPEQLASLIG